MSALVGVVLLLPLAVMLTWSLTRAASAADEADEASARELAPEPVEWEWPQDEDKARRARALRT